MYERELEVALDAAQLARKHLLQEYERFQVIPDAPADISTDADRQAQEIILQRIRQTFPRDGLCAEEATATLHDAVHTGVRVWIVDPIDGTRGFARKNGEFSVMIAFVDHGQIGVGVVAQPAVRKLTYAVRAQGCWRLDGDDDKPIRCQVTTIEELRKCTLTQSRSRGAEKGSGVVLISLAEIGKIKTTPDPFSAPIKGSRWALALEPANIVESYSAGIKLALVARGDADVYLNTYEAFHDWDICAGDILVTEAGGRVTGTAGQKLQYGLQGAWQKNGLLATNGRLHAATLRVIAG
jgi:3'(2'), 5'-bisphosphate nucleotidase